MASPILVTGGTGRLGRLVATSLRGASRSVRVLSRRSHDNRDDVQYVTGDLVSGQGIAQAVDGVDVVIHCASSRKGDVAAARNIVAAAEPAGVRHLVFISIVGVDQVGYSYFRAKRDAERVITASGLPWTILRSTAYYDYILDGARKLARLPVIPVPAAFPVQPVDTGEVAARLVELALGEPTGRVPDIGGPQVSSYVEMFRAYVRASRRRRIVLPVWMPITAGIRNGGLLVNQPTGSSAITGRKTWEQFLAEALAE